MKKVTKRQITIESSLRTSYRNKEGAHPVKLRVTFNRKSRYYPIQINGKNIFLKPTEWELLYQKETKRKNQEIINAIADQEALARESLRMCTEQNRPFTFEQFEKVFLKDELIKGFIGLFGNYIEGLLRENRIGTYYSYNCALQAFKNFRKNREIDPIDLTPEILKDFEEFLKNPKIEITKRGKTVIRTASKNTIAIYMRALKVGYNIAVAQNPSLSSFYPFARKQNDKGKYKIKTGSGKKGNALTSEEVKIFIDSQVEVDSPQREAKLLWLFSFYCQGMNFKDIAYLKHSNIYQDCISYVRHKTKDTELIENPITVPITDSILEIIRTLKNNKPHQGDYVFNILNDSMSPKKQDEVIRQKIKTTNKWLKRLCKSYGLPAITTYWARHTYASLLKHSGESIELIRELLGHSDIRTTETYLKRFDLDKKRIANERLISLLNSK